MEPHDYAVEACRRLKLPESGPARLWIEDAVQKAVAEQAARIKALEAALLTLESHFMNVDLDAVPVCEWCGADLAGLHESNCPFAPLRGPGAGAGTEARRGEDSG